MRCERVKNVHKAAAEYPFVREKRDTEVPTWEHMRGSARLGKILSDLPFLLLCRCHQFFHSNKAQALCATLNSMHARTHSQEGRGSTR